MEVASLVPDTIGHLQESCRVHASAGRCCFGSMQRTNRILAGCHNVLAHLVYIHVFVKWFNWQFLNGFWLREVVVLSKLWLVVTEPVHVGFCAIDFNSW